MSITTPGPTVSPATQRPARNAQDMRLSDLNYPLDGWTDAVNQSVTRWWPRVIDSFGTGVSSRSDALKAMGLRNKRNADMRAERAQVAISTLENLGLECTAAGT